MKPFQSRAIATAFLSTATVLMASHGQANLRLLPSPSSAESATLEAHQNLSTQFTSVQETSVPGLGTGFKATFGRQYASVSSQFASEVDASEFDGMYFMLKNTGNTVSRSSVELCTAYQPQSEGRLGETLTLQPGETRRIVIYINRDFLGKQMSVHPPQLDVPAQIMWGGKWNFNPARLKGWLMYNMGGVATVELQDLRLIKKRTDLTGLIDKYGQNSDLDGPWKVKSDGDLIERAQEEGVALATTSDAKMAVGSTALGTTRATGKWRFEKSASGNWFAVDPDGKRVWITGANNVIMDGRMIVDGKQEMYASLPPQEGAYGQFYDTVPYFSTGVWQRVYDMYRANLYKKFGQSYENTWRTRMVQRMKKWGLNAMAGTIDRTMVDRGVPYITHMQMFYYPTKLNVARPGWKQPNDPFAPDFASWCVTNFKVCYGPEIASLPRNLIGIAVGNEDTWGWMSDEKSMYQIPIAAMNASITQPCKQPLLDVLKRKYTNISGLNAAWGKSFASWDAMKSANILGDPTITPGMRTDFKLLLTTYADKNYSTIRASLLKAGYKGLFLGSRVALDQTPDEVLAVEGKYVDGHTINNYENDAHTWGRIAKLTKPVVITEYSVSAVDRGHYAPNKNFEVGTQAERAVRVRQYLEKAAATKCVAGAFFYGFAECPFTGRWSDDERWNAGLIDTTDSPYTEVVNAIRSFGAALPTLRRR